MQESRTPFVTGPLTESQDTPTNLLRDGARRANLVGPVSPHGIPAGDNQTSAGGWSPPL
jgi:hypothetical protein